MSKILSAVLSDEISLQDKANLINGTKLTPEERKLAERAYHVCAEREQLSRRSGQLEGGIGELEQIQQEFKRELEKLTRPPWFPALFVRMLDTTKGSKALVLHNNQPRVVEVARGINVNALRPADPILLNEHLNVVLEPSHEALTRGGVMARFEKWTDDGRAVIQFREERIVVGAGPLRESLDGDLGKIKMGDLVRWDENLKIAFERFEREEGKEFILKDAPNVGRDAVGGQDENLDKVLSFLTMAMVSPDKARDYGVSGKGTMLMIGPPGTGKTLMARVAANELSKISKKKVKFGVVRPGEWQSPYVGVTEANIRNCFAALKEATSDGGYAVLFMDEIESIGRIRGTWTNHHSDRFLASLLAELDGFADRTNIAVIAATNRKDLVDPALLERMSELEVQVGRPSRDGAKAIFGIHMPKDTPFHKNGSSSKATRDEALTVAVDLLYKADPIALISFQDGSSREVVPAEMVSGRMIEQVCKQARRRAFLRDVRDGERGVMREDMEASVAEVVARLATTISPQNAHSYIPDIPPELRIVRVDQIAAPNR